MDKMNAVCTFFFKSPESMEMDNYASPEASGDKLGWLADDLTDFNTAFGVWALSWLPENSGWDLTSETWQTRWRTWWTDWLSWTPILALDWTDSVDLDDWNVVPSEFFYWKSWNTIRNHHSKRYTDPENNLRPDFKKCANRVQFIHPILRNL